MDSNYIAQSPMTPREISQELDNHIIGQDNAKRAVAIALRNRWRRQQVAENLRNEITKFTEVGYVGRDVESIIRDLVDVSVKQTREAEVARVRHRAEDAAEEKVLDVLLPRPKDFADEADSSGEGTRQKFRKMLREGKLNDREIEIDLQLPNLGVEIMAPPGMEDMTNQLQGLFQNLGNAKTRTRKLRVEDALKVLTDEEAAKLINEDELKLSALENAEQNGIVFIDEIDKVAKRQETSGADISREGVQRDLLPLVEGCTVSTKAGMIKTDHILFIASGAFHVAKPSDLIPELQGRLPIRVELSALTVGDFVRILREPNASLTEQYTALLETEGIRLEYTDDGLARIAEVAWQVNEKQENIGARRLHTVMERLLESVSFDASDMVDQTIVIDADYVNEHLGELSLDEDLSQYIL